MDQIKIGKFIAQLRKQEGLTQMQLAERLNITDRAVSKWETGKAMPDVAIMIDLCRELKITVNDLLCGELVTVDNYSKELENNLIEVLREKEEADKRLLNLEIFIGVLVSSILFAVVLVAGLVPMENWLRITLVVAGCVIFFIGIVYCLRIEQIAGYYKCAKCGHRYVPQYKSVLWAMHVNRTRYMHCPECGEKSWQKKVLTKE